MHGPAKPRAPLGQKRALATAVSAALAGTQAAHSQAPPAEPGLEEIIVTATKRAESLQDVPVSVTAFGGADIERQGFSDLNDYAAFIPTLSFATREPGATAVVFRGVATSGLSFAGNSSAAIYLDEQPITSGGDNPDPRLVDIDRLEALSGPQGTLFGASSQSGTLRIITAKPDPSEHAAWVDVGTSSVSDGDAGYDVSAMVNVPLVQDKVALRLVGFQAEDAGYVDNVLGPSPGGTFDNSNRVADNVNTVKYSGGRAALRWNLGERWSADFTGLFQNTDVEGFGDVEPGAGDLEQIRFENEFLVDDWSQIGLTLNGDVGFADAVVSLSYFERDFRYEADNTTYEYGFNLASIYYGTLAYDFGGDPRGIAFDHRQDDRTTLEARLSSRADSGSRWSWIAGLFYSEEDGHTDFDALIRGYTQTNSFAYYSYYHMNLTGSPLDPTEVWFIGRYDTALKEGAIFGELSYDFTEHFAITAGGRWFQYDEDFRLRQQQPPGFAGATNLDRQTSSDDGDFVVKLNMSYRLESGNMAYFTYSEGFRNGGSTPVRDRSVLPGTYEPDLLRNFEVGAKSEWLDRRLRLNLNAYWMTWDDIQIQVEDPQTGVFALAVVNFPEALIRGGEAQLEWLAADRLTLGASVSYNNAELSESSTLCFPRPGGAAGEVCLPPALEGAPLPLTPDWKATLSFDYSFPTRLLNAAPFLRFDYAYTGNSVNSLAGFESVTFGARSNQLDSYETGDFQFGLEAERWTAALFLDNAWDERAEQFINNRWGAPRISINQPRTLGLTFKYSF
jgi:outer membrane receptor protein involved in Fe transport